MMVGQKLAGEILKVNCDPYEFTTDTGEVIELSHRYEYQDTHSNLEEDVFTDEFNTAS